MNKIYFGTRDRMRWVKAPAVNTPLSSTGWSNVGNDLNGGGYAKLSATASRDYQFTWGASPAKDIYDITDYRSGAYGDGLLYYVDPFAMRTNAFPAALSHPKSLCAIGRMGGTFGSPTGSRVEATNLATNPSFESPGATVEVRRNIAPTPRASGFPLPSWGTGGAGTVEVLPSLGSSGQPHQVATWTTVPTGGNARIICATGASSIIPVGAQQGSISLAASTGQRIRLTGDWYTPAGAWVSAFNVDAAPWIVPSTPYTHYFTLPAPPEPGLHLRLYVAATLGDLTPGAWIAAGALMAGDHGPYFDGSYSPDPDLTPEWTGPVNGSESRLVGRRAQAVSDGTGRSAIQSSTGVVSGARALRVLRTGAVGQAASGAQPYSFTAADLGKTFTVAVWCTIPEGYSPSQDINDGAVMSRGVFILNNTASGVQAPSTPGTHLVRAILAPTSDPQYLRLGGGGLVGQSVYWDDLTIVEGSHPHLMPFTGDSTASQGYKYRWTGTANASTSEKYVSADSPSYTGIPQPVGVSVTGADSPSVYVPVPPGYRLWVSYVATAPVLRTSQGTVPPTAPTATVPVWSSWSDGQDFRWSGTGTVWGAHALILPMGETPTPDHEWCVGKGNSGLRFSGEPTITGISAVVGGESGLVNGSVVLKETGLWE